eukprot:2036788-Rhodomonas_salina.1
METDVDSRNASCMPLLVLLLVIPGYKKFLSPNAWYPGTGSPRTRVAQNFFFVSHGHHRQYPGTQVPGSTREYPGTTSTRVLQGTRLPRYPGTRVPTGGQKGSPRGEFSTDQRLLPG